MIDFHCHLLPNIDDGPAHIDDSVAMAAALRDEGFTTVYCTPHLIKGFFEADNQTVRNAVAVLQTRLNQEEINLEILPGREYYLDEYLADYLKDPLPLGRTHYIMVEIPSHASPEFVKETFFRMKCGRFVPMIAHPERCGLFSMPPKNTSPWFRFTNLLKKGSGSKSDVPELLDYLKDIGCAFQGNLGSFNARYGLEVQRMAEYLKNSEIFTHFGTDAHTLRGITHLPHNMLPFQGT